MLARRVGSDRFTATAILNLGTLRGGESAGLAVTRGGPFEVGGQAIGIYLRGGRATVWRRGGGRYGEARRKLGSISSTPYLRIVADGRRYAFSYSSDGESWTRVHATRKGPIEETERIALTVGGKRGASIELVRATLTER